MIMTLDKNLGSSVLALYTVFPTHSRYPMGLLKMNLLEGNLYINIGRKPVLT